MPTRPWPAPAGTRRGLLLPARPVRHDVQSLYRHVTAPLAARGPTCAVEYGLCDWTVHAELPSHFHLIVSPPQKPPGDHPTP